MSTTIKISGWLLMIAMHSGGLKTAQFPTEALCKDGESLAVHGKTVAEVDHDTMVVRAAQNVDSALWELNNPRHEPATDEEWAIVREARIQPDVVVTGAEYHNGWPRSVSRNNYTQYWKVFEDGTIQKQRTYPTVATNMAVQVVDAPTDWIATTRCVPIPDEGK